MSVNQLIKLLQTLPAAVRKLPIVTYDWSWLVCVDKPTISFRDKKGLQVTSKRKGRRVVVI